MVSSEEKNEYGYNYTAETEKVRCRLSVLRGYFLKCHFHLCYKLCVTKCHVCKDDKLLSDKIQKYRLILYNLKPEYCNTNISYWCFVKHIRLISINCMYIEFIRRMSIIMTAILSCQPKLVLKFYKLFLLCWEIFCLEETSLQYISYFSQIDQYH